MQRAERGNCDNHKRVTVDAKMVMSPCEVVTTAVCGVRSLL